MTEPKFDNLLYLYTKAELNKALPMEWTIRAIQSVNPDQYQHLQSIDASIYKFWEEGEFIDAEIQDLEIMEFSWDVLQANKVTSRSYTKAVRPEVHDKVAKGLQEIYGQWKREASQIRLSSIADGYPYFDLLHGNDIPRLLKKIQRITDVLPKYTKDDSIPMREFAIFLRTPRRLNNESLIFHVKRRAKLSRVLGKRALKSFHPRLFNDRLFAGESWSDKNGCDTRNQATAFC